MNQTKRVHKEFVQQLDLFIKYMNAYHMLTCILDFEKAEPR